MGQHHQTDELLNRLAKVEGHIRGIRKMVQEGKPCDQVLIQMSAVKSAMNKCVSILFNDHFDHCVIENMTNKEVRKELTEFKATLGKFIG